MALTLAADIGGTKSLFGAFEGAVCRDERRFANADFSSFEDVVAAALDQLPRGRVARVCLAVAGPVADDGRSAKITNLPWRVDAAALESRFGLPSIRLVNDFAAAARGAVDAAPEGRHVLQAGQVVRTAPHLIVGAGTGLGMAIALPQETGWRIVPGEGGHVAFAPADAEQLRLWGALHAKFGRVTWERVVSGPGLAFIYRHVCQCEGVEPMLATTALADAPPGSPAARALALFLRCYGAYAGDMAMTILPRGGVHLAGGIAAKLLPQLSQGDFLAAFNAKAEHADLAALMPLDVCVDPALGLHGAAGYAEEKA